MTDRPPRRQSGRAPKALLPFRALEALTHNALDAAAYVQNTKGTPDVGPKSRYLSRIATDLELAIIERRPKDQTDRMCLDVAATALRILEQGDGHG
jgi:hypothetical protein